MWTSAIWSVGEAAAHRLGQETLRNKCHSISAGTFVPLEAYEYRLI
jgi:hypothetical protein